METVLADELGIPAPQSESPRLEELWAALEHELQAQSHPSATYRLQLNSRCGFREAASLVPYLRSLGISHLYVSPCLKAGRDSPHGYDVVDHHRLNPDLGSEDDFRSLVAALHARGMGLILDVVPNHMGIRSSENAWWIDVLENGPSSPYASFFDIDWQPPKSDLAQRVLLPVLGDQFGRILEDGELHLRLEDGAFWLTYHDDRFPIAPQTYATILAHRAEELEALLPADHPAFIEYHSILTAIRHLPGRTETDAELLRERRREKEVIKRRLGELCRSDEQIAAFLERTVQEFNGQVGDPRSFDRLDGLLDQQPYRLAHWRVAADEINYRRFFDVNELAAICMESPEVFQQTHDLVRRLLDEGAVQGLRIDHPDGLYDPADYLWRLQEMRLRQLARRVLERDAAAGESDGRAAEQQVLEDDLVRRWRERAGTRSRDLPYPLYLVIEKILDAGESIPEDWPVHGTVGYETLNLLTAAFVDRRSEAEFTTLYNRYVRKEVDFSELCYRSRRLILQVSLSSELGALGHQLDRISERDRRTRDFTLNSLTRALQEVIACFPVYRTYIDDRGGQPRDRQYVHIAVERAKRRNPAISASLFDYIRDVLLLDIGQTRPADLPAARRFVGRFQQMTSPVMAKAIEDTAFYIYNRLSALNEVGGSPQRFGCTVGMLHRHFQRRRQRAPFGLVATSTHDTKRSEDVRLRIAVLSEVPRAWRESLVRWTHANRACRDHTARVRTPSRNDEYLLYQTLIGTWPCEGLSPEDFARYVERIEQYMLKAAREAKVHSSWVSPHEPYETGLRQFVRGALGTGQGTPFLGDLAAFARKVADYGIWHSLAQVALKITAPGVPDFYQGSELWDDRLVDPDNRQPVDFTVRQRLLEELQRAIARPRRRESLLHECLQHPLDGRLKLLVTHLALAERQRSPDLFTVGTYRPLPVAGQHAEHVIAFARSRSGQMAVTIVPRLTARLTDFAGTLPVGEAVWADTHVVWPPDLPGPVFRNAFTEEFLGPSEGPPQPQLRIADALATFPVALLISPPLT